MHKNIVSFIVYFGYTKCLQRYEDICIDADFDVRATTKFDGYIASHGISEKTSRRDILTVTDTHPHSSDMLDIKINGLNLFTLTV